MTIEITLLDFVIRVFSSCCFIGAIIITLWDIRSTKQFHEKPSEETSVRCSSCRVKLK